MIPRPARQTADLAGSTLGHFRILSKVGQGGMGVVYEAHDEVLRRAVALKVLLPSDFDDDERRRRFLAEARAAAAVAHPNLAAIYEVGEADSHVFIAMELVSGATLRERFAGGALPVDEALAIAIGVASGLAKAHEHGIVHRDIKPENVMVTDNAVKLLDFGLATRSDDLVAAPGGPEASGEIVGTPAYMSPEHALGCLLDARTDVFSFGVLLHEMLAGSRPFERGAILTPHFIAGRPPPRLSELGVAVPPDLEDLVSECLSREPARRPKDGGALLSRLAGVPSLRVSIAPSSTIRSARAGAIHAQEITAKQVVSDLIGRQAEVRELGALLSGGARLITLLGPGGTGKTTLAAHLATVLRPRFKGGTWFCDLAEARDAAGIQRVVARAIGLPGAPGDATERIGRALAARGRALVVLDNFEQVVDSAGATVAPWMRCAPDASFVITTREVLRIKGEQLFHIGPLDVPEPGASPAEIEAASAVALFVERAREAKPAFVLDASNADTVAAIVRRLDGIPLAIELAAARMRALGEAALLERMPRRFDLLSVGRRDAPPRHATMRGAIDWSWGLLQTWEQAALAQCAVFGGGFSLEAAESVLDLSAWPEAPWAMDVVQALCDKSLLRTWQPAGARGDVRYGMYESIREYAAERLARSDPEIGRTARARHLGFYLGLAIEVGGPDGRRAADNRVLDRLALEHDNLHAALDMALAADGAPRDAALRLATAVWRHWLVRGRYAEGRAYLEAGLDRWRARDRTRASGSQASAGLAAMLGDFDAARAREEEALSVWRELGDEAGIALSLTSLGFQAYLRGELDRAMESCLEALLIARRVPSPMPLAFSLNIAAMAATKLGRLDEALLWLEEAARVCREAGNRQYLANVLESLGTALYSRSRDHAAALPCYRECLEIYCEMGDLGGAPLAVERFAQVEAVHGDAAKAARLFGAGRGMRDRLGAGMEPVMAAEYAPLLWKLRAALGEDRFAAAYAEGRALPSEQAVALALAGSIR